MLALVSLIVVSQRGLADEPKLLVKDVEVFNAPEIEAYAPGLKPMLAGRIDGEGYQVVSDDSETDNSPSSPRIRSMVFCRSFMLSPLRL